MEALIQRGLYVVICEFVVVIQGRDPRAFRQFSPMLIGICPVTKGGGMGRPLILAVEQKLPLVLSVLRGEGSVAEIGRRHQVSGVTLAKWRDAFLAGGASALANGSRRGRWAGGGAGGDQGRTGRGARSTSDCSPQGRVNWRHARAF